MHKICDTHTQFVVLGTGDSHYENMFKYYQSIMPGKVSANIYYSDEIAHRIYAGADAVLMPSRFEPCGLTQLIALRYGTVPIVRETGGLKDTVYAYNEYEKTGTGFSFANYDGEEMLTTINYAKKVYFEDRAEWDNIVKRGMYSDFSWDNSARKYEEIYQGLLW